MRNKNIFIRKETAFAIAAKDLPTFAHVTGYHDGNVHYEVDYVENAKKGEWRWHYADNPAYPGADFPAHSGTHIKPLEEFLSRFSPDVWNEYSEYANYVG